jgi:hypothetical protein
MQRIHVNPKPLTYSCLQDAVQIAANWVGDVPSSRWKVSWISIRKSPHSSPHAPGARIQIEISVVVGVNKR